MANDLGWSSSTPFGGKKVLASSFNDKLLRNRKAVYLPALWEVVRLDTKQLKQLSAALADSLFRTNPASRLRTLGLLPASYPFALRCESVLEHCRARRLKCSCVGRNAAAGERTA